MFIWKTLKKYPKSKENLWNNKIWIKKIEKRIKINLKSIKSKKEIKLNTFCAESPLPLLLLNQKKKIKILDFGSGSLEMPLKIIFDSKNDSNIEFFIIETESLISLYKKYLQNIKLPKNIKINFNTNVNFKIKYDYIHISDSFQYVENWKDFLKKISNSKSNILIFNSLTAGEIPTYDTTQKFYDISIPYRFYNIREIINELKNYKVIYKTKFLNKMLNKYTEYPQNNFKKKYRLGYPCTIILKKNN